MASPPLTRDLTLLGRRYHAEPREDGPGYKLTPALDLRIPKPGGPMPWDDPEVAAADWVAALQRIRATP
jgi:hypothetical protein